MTAASGHPLHVPNKSAYYVRTALYRALQLTLRDIENAEKFLARTNLGEDAEIVADMRESAKTVKEYNEQWLREALEAFQALPTDLYKSDTPDSLGIKH